MRVSEIAAGSSPHTRGAHDRRSPPNPHQRIIPAYAGSTIPVPMDRRAHPDHPRIRGEHSPMSRPTTIPTGSSPHTRGAHTNENIDMWIVGIIPAYAGSTISLRTSRAWRWDHPRIRGEHSPASGTTDHRAASSPHTRGAPIPVPMDRRAHPDHPRIRGEHDGRGRQADAQTGSSPHTRGAPAGAGLRPAPSRIIPAYAGSTSATLYEVSVVADHPRIRGEHMSIGFRPDPDGGSSPHTRGAPVRDRGALGGQGIIPAYAGSTRLCGRRSGWSWDHPRIRGEHETHSAGNLPSSGSSPHTRGAHCWNVQLRTAYGIIPAYAGSTRSGRSGPHCRKDHPRIRGEH